MHYYKGPRALDCALSAVDILTKPEEGHDSPRYVLLDTIKELDELRRLVHEVANSLPACTCGELAAYHNPYTNVYVCTECIRDAAGGLWEPLQWFQLNGRLMAFLRTFPKVDMLRSVNVKQPMLFV